MNRRLVVLLGLGCLPAAGCIVPEGAKPSVALGGDVATKFVHRGMTQSDNGVFRPRLALGVPVENGDTIGLTVQGNMDLADNNGDAWFPRGHGGRFSEIDFIADYRAQLDEVTSVRAGVFRYVLPNGLEFANDGRGGPGEERGSTTELFVTISRQVLGATPYFSWHYDFDEVHGAYYRAGVTEDFPLDEAGTWSVVLDGSLGYSTSAQSSWMYDLDQSGFADLRGSATVFYKYDDRTRLSAGLHGSAMMDSQLDRWFNDVGVFDDDPIWISLGVDWVF